MQPQLQELPAFLNLSGKKEGILLDVRSEAEFLKGNIPGSASLPIMDNAQRVTIGTLYKQQGREAAVLKGFELISPLFYDKILKALELAPSKEVLLYCWRGGMRSNIMAWVLSMAGFKVHLLKGGYKSYRQWSLQILQSCFKIVVLGGKTGSGKTEVLQYLKKNNEQIIDLENLANHRGSAFGNLGLPEQPSQEQFENLLAWEVYRLDPNVKIWFENESRSIGKLNIPNNIYDQMRNAMVVDMDVDEKERSERILKEYGVFPPEELRERTIKINTRLGGQHCNAALQFLEENNLKEWLKIILIYYDKAYLKGNEQRAKDSIEKIKFNWHDIEFSVQNIIHAGNKICK